LYEITTVYSRLNARLHSDLQRSEAFLAQAQSISSTGSFGWNVLSGEIYWSEETHKIFELDRAAKPTLEWVLQRVHPHDLALVRETIGCASREGVNFDLEHRLLTPDGRVKHLHVLARALKTSSGNLEFLGAVTDITERKRAEEEQTRLGQRLRQAEKMEAMGTLAGGIAHDFNNILGAILGYGELAQKTAAEGSVGRRYLDNVMQAGARAKLLVERILAFSRSGVTKRGPINVQAVIEEALELLAASLAPDIRLEKRLEAGDAAIVGDATQLHQVAMNLSTNASQAMEHGGVLEVTLDRAEVAQNRPLSHGNLAPGVYVRLCVNDTGSGIPPHVLDRMFDPFFTTKEPGEGTGLGLSLVQSIVADLGGAIDVRTSVGRGTSFTVWLPIAGEMAVLPAEVATQLPRGNGQSVMIVDDEKPLVGLAEEILAELGYEPIGFSSSTAALEAFRAAPQRFDIVLTDETMPEIIGTDLAREIALLRPDVPIVLMSGYGGAQLPSRARAAGIREILHKPLQRKDIAECLGRVLRSLPLPG
jgi:signal transduction histidine kinase/ActR/RegA family two-component response regulator